MLERFIQTNRFSQGMAITSRAMSNGCAENDTACILAERLPKVSKEDNILIWSLQTINDVWGANNATANSSNNLIQISRALQNNLTSNPVGLACVVAHEAAHIERNHTKEKQQQLTKLDKIASEKINSAVANAYKAKKSNEFWAAVAVGINAYNAGYQSSQGNYSAAAQSQFDAQRLANQITADQNAGSLLSQQYRQIIEKSLYSLRLRAPQTLQAMNQMSGLSGTLVKRTMRDVKDYILEFALEMKKLSRLHELEADTLAVTYMANASLDPNRCIDVIDLLHRQDGDTSTHPMDTHPGEEKRTNDLRQAIEELPPRLKRKYKNVGPRFKYPLVPYVYDSETEVVRLSLPGTNGMTQGANNRKSVVDSVFGN